MTTVKKTLLGELSSIKRGEEEELAEERAQELKLPYLNLDRVPVNISDIVLLPEQQARNLSVCVIQRKNKTITLAALHPDDPGVRQAIKEFEAKGYQVYPVVVSYSSLEGAWKKYRLYKKSGRELRKTFVIPQDRTKELTERLKTKREVEEELHKIKEEDVSPFLEVLFIAGIQAKVSDIHIEPEEESIKIRFRIDGVLQDVAAISRRLYELTRDRLKILAELQLNVHTVPQDGRFTIRRVYGDGQQKDVGVRLSLIPSYYGQTLVMRLLGIDIVRLDLEALGMEEHQRSLLTANLSLPNGMILATGPTGSGKTTFLYAALDSIKKPEINIITIENPIEYKIEGITQTQIDNEKGYTFEAGLPSILRQDPDVVLVGEIRSPETAATAVNAALTGHLVFSTLHTNDAPGAIERLINLNVRESLISAALRLVVAQRLVRKLCDSCKVLVSLSAEIQSGIERAISLISPRSKVEIPTIPDKVYGPKGCSKCFDTGYAGRTGIFELFEMSDVIEQKILSKATTFELRKTAIDYGMLTLLQHGIIKMIQGITSLEEVQRVAGDAQYIEELYGKAVVGVLARSLVVNEPILERIRSLASLTVKDVKPLLDDLSEEALIETLIALGTCLEASDIHLEPKEEDVELKYRVDGVLLSYGWLRKKIYPWFLERIRDLGGMGIGVHKRIQEGRFSALVGGEAFHIDIRVSFIPGGYGASALLRLLPQEFTFSIEKLGLEKPLRKKIEGELAKPNGLILAVGPTGAGKSTTLHAMLQLIARKRKKVITIENPIGYRIPEVIQTQVDLEGGYDFPDAIRAILRQDPDVIMVDEIRDTTTAKTVFQAASTGHLVFSTLHTNDALGVIERLQSLDMPAEQLVSILNVVIAERLVRRLCEECKKSFKPSSQLLETIKAYIASMPDYLRPSQDLSELVLFKPQGCKRCNDTGFRGRIGIFEAVFFSEALKKLMRKNPTRAELIKEAKQSGSLFFKEDGVLKLIAGITSQEEAESAIGKL